MSQPVISRPIFSTDDFRLIRRAVVHYIRTAEVDEDMPKFDNLHHRLGRGPAR
ncbi:hypothetical protein [Aurantiacibacter spongiae]|uniref:hypothetical protein n=1 Tax=Aurantiacibacter spongiae TaxID=2488860 RepID=UPI0015F2C343|nr:hypothetical protein [Aurantiacibacter spongiae]